MKGEITELFERIDALLCGGKRAENTLPSDTFYLDEDVILCLPRPDGDSRYPYSFDGFCLWAYQSGYFCANESTFTVFPVSGEGKQPYLAFFAGVKGEDGLYTPVSLSGAAPQPRERAERYTVFTPWAAYYLTRAEGMRFALRISLGEKKSIRATLYAENAGKKRRDIYFASYWNCLLRFAPAEDAETPWFKSCETYENGFLFHSIVDFSRERSGDYYALIRRRAEGAEVFTTTSRADFTGAKSATLNCAEPLFAGRFKEGKPVCRFTDTAIAGEIAHYELPAGEGYEEDIEFSLCAARPDLSAVLPPAAGEFDEHIANMRARERAKERPLVRLDGGLLDRFIKGVMRQVEWCALAKTSSISMLGVRDVFQQIEAALMWDGERCRAKMLEALNFIGTDGRVPRQYAMPPSADAIPQVDLRRFIDQGPWIIDAVYTYLAHTGDAAFLGETCGYYRYENDKVFLSDERDSVLCHLSRIMEELLSKIDEKTGCLRILYGDWNDALDGLGYSHAGEFGSGVSVMASLQLTKALREYAEILTVYTEERDRAARYTECCERLKASLLEHAVQRKGEELRIVHGWGDGQSYYVGSFCDVDGVSRDGLAANAFWVLSESFALDETFKRAILASYGRLDSKYGIKTFHPPFARGTKGVGRIGNLPAGTAENGAAYVHATMFAIWSLFAMGEPELAWEQLMKALPLTHEKISVSPFVMVNSYVCNEEFSMDGESMNDWYTGSAAVLVKLIVRGIFGIRVTQKTLTVRPAAYFPSKSAEISLRVRGCRVHVLCRRGERERFFVNGAEQKCATIALDALGETLDVEYAFPPRGKREKTILSEEI